MHAVFALFIFSAGLALGADALSPTAVQRSPWYVKAASDQIVNYCFWCGMMGGSGGYTTTGGGLPLLPSTVSFSSLFTDVFTTNTATTLTTTIPGSVVTIFGAPGVATTTFEAAQTFTSVFTPPDVSGTIGDITGVATLATPTTTSGPRPNRLERIEEYAHAVAEALVAPAEMTSMLSSAYNAILDRGFIHASEARDYIRQASAGLKALETDPAYAKQSARLAAQPTKINLARGVAKATASHSAGFAKLLGEHEGTQAWSDAKSLGKEFLAAFGL